MASSKRLSDSAATTARLRDGPSHHSRLRFPTMFGLSSSKQFLGNCIFGLDRVSIHPFSVSCGSSQYVGDSGQYENEIYSAVHKALRSPRNRTQQQHPESFVRSQRSSWSPFVCHPNISNGISSHIHSIYARTQPWLHSNTTLSLLSWLHQAPPQSIPHQSSRLVKGFPSPESAGPTQPTTSHPELASLSLTSLPEAPLRPATWDRRSVPLSKRNSNQPLVPTKLPLRESTILPILRVPLSAACRPAKRRVAKTVPNWSSKLFQNVQILRSS